MCPGLSLHVLELFKLHWSQHQGNTGSFICMLRLKISLFVFIWMEQFWYNNERLESCRAIKLFFFWKLHPLSCLFLTTLRISGSGTLTPGHLVTCDCMGFQWCESVTVPKRLRKKVEVSHVHNECQRSLVVEEKELFLGWRSTVFYREFFHSLLIFLSSLDSLPPASNLSKAPLCKQNHLVLLLLKLIFSMVLMAN